MLSDNGGEDVQFIFLKMCFISKENMAMNSPLEDFCVHHGSPVRSPFKPENMVNETEPLCQAKGLQS